MLTLKYPIKKVLITIHRYRVIVMNQNLLGKLNVGLSNQKFVITNNATKSHKTWQESTYRSGSKWEGWNLGKNHRFLLPIIQKAALCPLTQALGAPEMQVLPVYPEFFVLQHEQFILSLTTTRDLSVSQETLRCSISSKYASASHT